jgi:hypothetical protein
METLPLTPRFNIFNQMSRRAKLTAIWGLEPHTAQRSLIVGRVRPMSSHLIRRNIQTAGELPAARSVRQLSSISRQSRSRCR